MDKSQLVSNHFAPAKDSLKDKKCEIIGTLMYKRATLLGDCNAGTLARPLN
jgi:hypothetical protein